MAPRWYAQAASPITRRRLVLPVWLWRLGGHCYRWSLDCAFQSSDPLGGMLELVEVRVSCQYKP